jgi:hypothetical protein
MHVLLAAAGIVISGDPGTARAREPLTLDLESSVRSRFVWRGEMWTDDPVFWQTATLRWRGFRSWNFFNIDLTDLNGDRYELNEYDFILDYTFRFGRWSVAPGMLRFTSPTGFFKTTTKYTLDIRMSSPWNPRLRIRIDTKHSRGSYYIFSASRRAAPLGGHFILALYGEFGLSQPRYYRGYLSDRIAATDALLGVSAPVAVGKGFTLSPFVEFTSLLDRSVRGAQEKTGAKKDAVTVGVMMGKIVVF